MAILITELAIQADGTYALELYNTGPDTVDLSNYKITDDNGPITSLPGAPTSFAPGETVTIGHSSIAGLDAYPDDAGFTVPVSGGSGVLNLWDESWTNIDGIRAGGSLSSDVSYEGDITRTPNTTSSTNISDFSVLGGFSTNTLGTVLCFCEGTVVATPQGEVPIQEFIIGDEISAADGRVISIKWIGHQTVSTRFGPAERLMLVRFAAGSLGDDVPHTDLTVTADHGMLVDGVICHAGALVNGTTITRVPLSEMGESYTVYHVETEAHEIILANGAPAETFIDNVSRRVFDNFAEFDALFGDVPEMVELPYPRAMSARQVPASVRRRLPGSSEAC